VAADSFLGLEPLLLPLFWWWLDASRVFKLPTVLDRFRRVEVVMMIVVMVRVVVGCYGRCGCVVQCDGASSGYKVKNFLMSRELDHMIKATGLSRWLWLSATLSRAKASAGPASMAWPGLARPKQAWLGPAHGFGPGQANH
jgi:hypothetical protein